MTLSIRSRFVLFISILVGVNTGISQTLASNHLIQKKDKQISVIKTNDLQVTKNISKFSPQELTVDDVYGTLGFSFGMGLMESDYTYNWQFIYQLTPKLAMEGTFKHVLGEAADSYFLTTGFSYLLVKNNSYQGYLNAGMGVINTIPQRSIDTNEISHMTINYGVGFRKNIRKNMALVLNANRYSVFLRNEFAHFKEFTVGLLVGNFWD